MMEKAEWEIVDNPQTAPRPTLSDTMRALLGPWWRWKLAATAVAVCLVVAIVIALAGVLALTLLIAAVTVIGLRKLGALFQGGKYRRNTWLEPQNKSRT